MPIDLNNANAYLAAIVDSSDDAIIAKTLDGVITTWNQSAERIFGYTPEEAIGQHISLIIPVDRLDEEFIILGKVKSGQRVDHFETIRQAKNGDLVNISLTVSPILDNNGTIIGASKVARNITEQKATVRALEESNRRRDDFLATISHELRTPLSAILGLSQLMIRSEPLTSKGQQYMTMISQSGDSLLGLINNILDFSKAETGALEFETIDFSLPEQIERVIVLQDAAARQKGLDLRVAYQGALKDLYTGDPLRLRQVLTNLVANAIKFSDAGVIEIIVTLQTDAGSESWIQFDVSDTGIGIPADKLGAIFEKFTQADTSTARLHGGSGLGLSISKALTEAMGGTISVVSTQGLGSTFTVNLKFGNVENGHLIELTETTAERNILLVEDFEANIVVLGSMLEDLGYSFDVARNGMEAVRQAERGTYDLILMDVQMPGMDGFESTTRIRAFESRKGTPRTPIVAVTAHVFEKDRNKCLEVGMDDYMSKPVDPAQLETVLNRLIRA